MVSVDIENKSDREIGRVSIHGQSALGRNISQSFCGDHIPILGSSGVQQVCTITGDSSTGVTVKEKKNVKIWNFTNVTNIPWKIFDSP